ncbi:MAG: sulfotransferase, partial [Dehalococcoidia bacterium]
PVGLCAISWRRKVMRARSFGSNLGPQEYQEVIYEDLVDNPADTLQKVTGALGLPMVQEMLKFHEGKTQEAPGLSSKDAWLPPTPGLRDWRDQLSSQQKELFEALAGDLLSALGYERAFESFSPEIQERAAWCEEIWPKSRAGKL